MRQELTAILPCSDLGEAQRFFERIGFVRDEGSPDEYRMLRDGLGGYVHPGLATPGWLDPARNPFGLYLYREDVDAVAAAFRHEIIEPEGPSDKPWGMYEFAVYGPDGVLVGIGWPSDLRDLPATGS